MISHDNIIFEALSAFTMIFNGARVAIPNELRIVSYLPLSHVAGQMLDIVGPLIVTGVGNGYGPPEWANTSYCTWFARPDALKGTLKQTLLACRPTFFLGVPRVWEKFREALLEIGRKNTGIKAKLSAWAKRQAAAAAKEPSSVAPAARLSRTSSQRSSSPRSRMPSVSTRRSRA